MGRSQVLYNKTKAKMRRGRDGSSILSELTDGSGTPSAPPPPRHHQPQFMASYAPEQSACNEMSAAAEYSESEPSVSITESIQQQQLRQQQQVEEADETVNRLLLEMPSATSAYAQSYAGRSSLAAAAASSHYNTTSSTGRRGGRHYYPHDLLRLDDAASLPSLLDYNMPLLLNKNDDDASNVLQVDIIDACLQQQYTLAERLNIPQHLLDTALPQAEHETDSACDDVVSIKSMFHDRLHQANDRIMAARSPSPSPTRMKTTTRQGAALETTSPPAAGSPRNPLSTPRSLLPAPSDENSILAEEAVQELMLDASSSSDDDGKGDGFILASRQSSDDDDDDETMQLLGSITTKQPSLSTNGSSTLAGEGILDQPMMRRSLLAPLHPPSQPMHSAMNEQQQQPVPTMADIAVPKSTTAIEGILKIHRKSLSPPRDARVNKVAQQSPQVAAAAAAAAASSKKNVQQQQQQPPSAGRAPSPASLKMRTPILVPAAERHHLPFPPNQNDNVAQFTGEDMTAISSVGPQSLRDDARHPPPPSPPLPKNNGWAPKPGESFEIKTVPGRARASSPRSSPKMLTKSPSVISPSAHSKALPNTKAKTEKSASPISSPKPKVVSEAAHYVSSRSLSPKQQSLLHRIRSASPNAQAATASAATASAAPPANKKPPPQLKVNTNFDSHDKRFSKSPSRAGTASRAQLYPIHDVSVTAQKQDSTPEANKLPSNDDAQALLYSAGLKSQRRGRSPVRRGDSSRQKEAAKPPPSAMAASGADDGVDNTSAQTSAMLSSIQLLEDCDTVPGIEVTERKAKSILKSSSGRGGAGSFSYQGDVGRDLGQSKSRASDIATYVEDESNQGLEIKRKPSDNKRSSNQTNSSSPLRIKIATKEVPTFSRNSDKTGNRSSPPQRQMVDVIDLSAVDSASLSPSRIIKAIRTGQPLLRDKTSSSVSPTKHRDKSPTTTRRDDHNRRSVSSERKRRHSKSPRRNKNVNHDDEEGIEVGDVGELNDWLDSVIA